MNYDLEDVIDNLKFSYISKSSIHGNGLFANADIDENITLGELDGQFIQWDLHKEYDFTLEWNAITKNILLVRPYRTKYSFINHSREPNLEIHYNPLRIITKKSIKLNEELTLDYRKEPLPDEYITNIGDYL
ncbi:MAG: SET domain-containing protein-lysine N-methyltransferase [Candidatus Marinarcus sp.]|uniref:SET domain-containing protein-lysine N-methyltransferase n=1 Tax=Candidatus Marinarcus sp. TaxID=3100987 RepID=UPI003B001C06